MTIRNEHQQSPCFTSSAWGDIPPGDRFVALGYDPTVTLCYEPQKWSHDDLIRDLELLLRSAGSIGPCYEECFAGLEDGIDISERLKIQNHESSKARIHDPVPEPIRRSTLNTLSDACPSLDSDHGGSSDGTEDGDAPTALEAASGTPTASGRLSVQRNNPPLCATIRQVLISDPSFAELVIAAINQLPIERRECLVGYDTECVDGSSSGPSKSGGRPFKKRRTSGHNSKQNGGGSSRADGNGGNGGDDNEGEREGEGDGTSSSATIRNKDKKCGWNCPFLLAYSDIHTIGRFSRCSSANMTERHLWKAHLCKHHSPAARDADPNSEEHSKFYMTSDKLNIVVGKIDAHVRRPREVQRWKAHLMVLFMEVWFTIFPKEEFPHLKEPLSQFHISKDEFPDLGQHLASQAETLVEAMRNAEAKAKEGFMAEAIASNSDSRPTADNTKEMISNAIAIVLLNSPAAIGATQWLARASTDKVEAAGKQHRDNHVYQPTTIQCDEQAQPKNDEAVASPETSIVPQTPYVAPAGPGPIHTLPVPLFPNGTQVELRPLNGTRLQNDTQTGYLNLPSTFYVASTRPIPSQPSFIGTTTMMDPNVIQPATDFVHGDDLFALDGMNI